MLNDKLPYLKEHYDLRSGLHQRIILDEKDGSMRPLLNIDVTHRAFPRQYTSLIDLLHAIQREQTTPRILIDFKKPLPTDIAEKLAAHLDGLEICYKIDDTNNGIAKFFDIGFRSAFEIFSKKGGNTKMVQEYFTENKLEIKHPFLQCIRLGFEKRHFSVPMECCSIRGDQVSSVKLGLSKKNSIENSKFSFYVARTKEAEPNSIRRNQIPHNYEVASSQRYDHAPPTSNRSQQM